MSAIRSATSIASSWSCVTITVVVVHLVVQAAQPDAQLLADARVERAERLVEQQHLRLDGERAGERHALPLAAGELRRVAVGEAVELHELEQLVDARLRSPPSAACGSSSPKATFVPHGHVLEGRVVLEDEADAALLRRAAASRPRRRS